MALPHPVRQYVRRVPILALLLASTVLPTTAGSEPAKPQLSAQAASLRLQPVPAARPGARGTYRELRWEELQPKDWDPAAGFRQLDLSKLKDSDPRAIAALRELRAAWNQAPVRKDLAGWQVRIAGYVIPLDRQGDRVSELLLVPYFGACIHSPPPPANQTIHIVLNQPRNGIQTMDTFWVNGQLSVDRGDSGLGIYGYRIRAERLDPFAIPRAQGAGQAPSGR
ncbi:DUF3299 domain-containing protein [Dechloromonas sp. ZY10]|uniref:DUF3299 domain-containing protein n=1 Tax=Dechloromonas aquae TaxID=2664436 RepID=UPI00352828B6